MSVADTLHDAVAELDEYIAAAAVDDWGEGAPSAPWHAELLAVRDRMENLRMRIDMAYRNGASVSDLRAIEEAEREARDAD